jgi:hypothetical protein
VPEDDEDLSMEAIEVERVAAAHRLTLAFAARTRAHLNTVAETVFLSHARQPIAEVLIELMEQANTNIHHVPAESLVDAANAISLGRRFEFV